VLTGMLVKFVYKFETICQLSLKNNALTR